MARLRFSRSMEHRSQQLHVAGGLTRHPGEAQICQGIAEHAVPAGRQHDGQCNHHKDMRPVVVPIFTSRNRPRARSGGLRIFGLFVMAVSVAMAIPIPIAIAIVVVSVAVRAVVVAIAIAVTISVVPRDSSNGCSHA
jgi:hypothetical protein